jgi:superfamily II DNA helicase RecQ
MVIQDTTKLLRLRTDCVTIKLSFDRPNLRYAVVKKSGNAKAMEELVEYIQKRPNPRDSGIVYCLTRKDCETVSEYLEEKLGKGRSLFYHAGIEDPRERQARQDAWARDEVPIVCATIAFGMGIDKPHVRFVVHFSLAKSLVNFYQESGRGGRDGLETDCTIFYSYGDKLRIEKMIRQENPSSGVDNSTRQVHQQLVNLTRMVQFCENETQCRRSLILEYFGEVFDKHNCRETCDNCLATSMCELATIDVTEVANELVIRIHAAVLPITEAVLLKQVKDGPLKHGYFATTLKHLPQNDKYQREICSRVLHRLICENLLGESEQQNRAGYSTVYITLGQARLSASDRMELTVRTKKRKVRVPEVVSRHQSEDRDGGFDVPSTPPSRVQKKKRKVVVLVSDDDEEEDFEKDPVENPSSSSHPFESFRVVPPKLFPHSDGRLTSSQQQKLLGELKEFTKKLMEDHKVSRHWMVWTEKNLIEMAARIPLNPKELMDLEEVPEEKVKQFGMKTIGAIFQFLNANVPEFDMSGFMWRKPQQ